MGNFPPDCYGEIILFINDSNTIVHCLEISKEIYFYITKVNPMCCKHVSIVHTTKTKFIPVTRKFLFVGKLFVSNIEPSISLSSLPNLSILNFEKFDMFKLDFSNLKHFFTDSKSLKILKEVSLSNCDFFDHHAIELPTSIEKLILKKCRKISEYGIQHLKNLKVLKINQCAVLGEDVLYNFRLLEELEINSKLCLDGGAFIILKNLKKLVLKNIIKCNNFQTHLFNLSTLVLKNIGISGDLIIFEGITSLTLEKVNTIKDSALEIFKNLKRLGIKDCKRITGEFCKFLGKNLESLSIEMVHESKFTCDHFSNLQNLKVLQFNVKGIPIKNILNLRKIEQLDVCDINDQVLLNVPKENLNFLSMDNLNKKDLKVLKECKILKHLIIKKKISDELEEGDFKQIKVEILEIPSDFSSSYYKDFTNVKKIKVFKK